MNQLPPATYHATYHDPTDPNRITTVVLRGDDHILDWSEVEDALAEVSQATERLDMALVAYENADKAFRRAGRELNEAKESLKDKQGNWHAANNAIYDQVVPKMGETQK